MKARTDRLVVEDLGKETVVYDLDTKKAHCLNDSIRWIWRQCDGDRTAGQIAKDFAKQFPGGDSAEIVGEGLRQLSAANLVVGRVPAANGISRRGVVGGAAPLLMSIMVPAAAAAMSGATPPTRVPRTPKAPPPPKPPKVPKVKVGRG